MAARGLGGDAERIGDLCIRVALGHEPGHGEFAGGQWPPRFVDHDTPASLTLNGVGPVGEWLAVEAGGDRADLDCEGHRVGISVRADVTRGEIEAGPGRLPDPSDAVPTTDGRIQAGPRDA